MGKLLRNKLFSHYKVVQKQNIYICAILFFSMKWLVRFLLALVLVSSLSFVGIALVINPMKAQYNYDNGHQILEFSTFTSAVCEIKETRTFCKDELFVNCNGSISTADKIKDCNGIRVDVPILMGAAVFDSKWEDPRK